MNRDGVGKQRRGEIMSPSPSLRRRTYPPLIGAHVPREVKAQVDALSRRLGISRERILRRAFELLLQQGDLNDRDAYPARWVLDGHEGMDP